jgi:hypothetical protein
MNKGDARTTAELRLAAPADAAADGDGKKKEQPVNEVLQFLNGRFLSAPESVWRIFENSMQRISPNVVRLTVHLEDEQTVCVANAQRVISQVHYETDEQMQAIAGGEAQDTMLTAFFAVNDARRLADLPPLLYKDVVKEYWWNRQNGKPYRWTARRNPSRAIGRMYTFVHQSHSLNI